MKRVGRLYIMDDYDAKGKGGPDTASFIEADAQLPAPTRYEQIRRWKFANTIGGLAECTIVKPF